MIELFMAITACVIVAVAWNTNKRLAWVWAFTMSALWSIDISLGMGLIIVTVTTIGIWALPWTDEELATTTEAMNRAWFALEWALNRKKYPGKLSEYFQASAECDENDWDL